jgi:polyisoprenoid-binding protein YceI
MKKLIYLSISILFLSVTVFAQSQTWKIDKSHSKVGFSVSHLVITDVEGSFKDFEASISTNKNGELEKVEAVIKTTSINTENNDRDNHLKSDDFFNAEKFPEMKFVSKTIKKSGKNNYKITGELTIRDVTKTVTLDAKLNGKVTDPWGNTKMGWYAQTTINRFDYNLKWNKALEAGGLVVGKEVTIKINSQFTLSK